MNVHGSTEAQVLCTTSTHWVVGVCGMCDSWKHLLMLPYLRLDWSIDATRFFWDSHWLEIWSNHFFPSMGPNGGSVATDSGKLYCQSIYSGCRPCPGSAISSGPYK